MLVCYLVFVLGNFLIPIVSADGIDVDLSSYSPDASANNTFSNSYIISKNTVKLDIYNINNDVGFLVIQVHSFIENVTLSQTSKLSLHSYVTGTNIGLIWGNNGTTATLYLLRNIKIGPTVKILLVINVYDEDDPVPGGCNLTFETFNAPYQKISYTDDIIEVKSQPPSAYGVSCDNNPIQIDMFHLYLTEYDNKEETYFNSLSKMISAKLIKLNGKKVVSLQGRYKYGRLFSSYRGTGEVFGIIATYKNRSSAYVSAVSYGCDILNWDTDCVGPITDHWKFLCAVLLLFGLFICLFGHKFFRITLFLIGFTFGTFITYLMISHEDPFTEKAVTTMVFGFVYGFVSIFVWWKFGIPLLSVSLAFFLAATVIGSTIFYAGLANFDVFTNDLNYWGIFFCFIIVCLMVWTPMTMHGHIFACSLLGSYATVVAMNYYLGGNLQYIILNTYRRVVVQNFRLAVIDPPFQDIDLLHWLFWILLLLFGNYIQLRSQRNKPPFPPHRRSVESEENENTPLLRERAPPPDYVW